MSYDVRRIFRELADDERRRRITTSFWRHGDNQSKALATAQLARALHFRDESMRKLPMEKKADLLASRAGAHEFDQILEVALMQYHTQEHNEMLSAFLDLWNIPHVNGSIEVDEYKVPTAGQVRDAVHQLEARYDKRDIAIYLATAGLLMADEWRDATWPVVDELKIEN
ncbi:MAG TPA: hypothetical protein VHU41_14425 [Thermoanaerobaculia bacterium]|jgi:hypothetical protein|nr:hypothetical protein [Thermoanaerobaculia bacterium]